MIMPNFCLAMVQVEPNRYFTDLSSSNEGNLGRLEESETSIRFTQGGLHGVDQLDVRRSKENLTNT